MSDFQTFGYLVGSIGLAVVLLGLSLGLVVWILYHGLRGAAGPASWPLPNDAVQRIDALCTAEFNRRPDYYRKIPWAFERYVARVAERDQRRCIPELRYGLRIWIRKYRQQVAARH
jgi:hypothetical protein